MSSSKLQIPFADQYSTSNPNLTNSESPIQSTHVSQINAEKYPDVVSLSPGPTPTLSKKKGFSSPFAARKDTMKDALKQLQVSKAKNLKEFVASNFKQRTCIRYIENSYRKNTCYCNRSKQWHEDEKISTDYECKAEEWSVNTCTVSQTATCYGQLKLQGFGRVRALHRPKFIRLDSERTNFDPLWELFLSKNYWNMTPPDLILSINGGAKKMQSLSLKMIHKLKEGIIKLATGVKSTWLITFGFNIGILQIVGQAVQDYICAGGDESSLHIIGICSWGAVYNNACLQPENGVERAGDIMKTFEYFNITENPGRGQAVLEPNHTHFIFCDNGTDRQFGNELLFRSSLENFLVKKLKELQDVDRRLFSAPVVQIVIEGGKKAILTAGYAAAMGTPVVTVKGSGRAANELAWARNLRSNVKMTDGEARLLILRKIETYDATWKCTVKEKADCVEILFKFGKNDPKLNFDSSLLSIFNAEYEDDLEKTILFTILRHPAYQKSTMTQLMLSMAWNRADIAENQIFSEANKASWKDMHLDSAMEDALIKQQKDFVELFMDHGISMDSFLTKNVLQRLYESTVTSHTSTAERLLRKLESQNLCSRRCLWNLCCTCRICCGKSRKSTFLDYLVGNEVPNLEDADNAILDAVNRLVELYTDYAVDDLYTHENLAPKCLESTCSLPEHLQHDDGRQPVIFPPYKANGNRKFTSQDLFIWSLLNQNLELAFLFWRHGKDQIGSALVGFSILKNIAKDAEYYGELELQSRLEKDACLFEELAVGVLSICNEKSKDLTRNLLIRKLPFWNGQTVLALAEANECMDLLYQTSVQNVLTNTWNGGMESDTPRWKVFVCMLFPFLIPPIIFNTHLVKKAKRTPKNVLFSMEKESLIGGEIPESKKDEISIISRTLTDVERVDIKAPNAREYNEDLKVEEAISGMTKRTQREMRLLKLAAQRRGFRNLSFLTCILLFFSAPRVKYALNVVATIVFLTFFSYLILVKLRPLQFPCLDLHGLKEEDVINTNVTEALMKKYNFTHQQLEDMKQPHWTEYYVFIFAVTYVAEEFRQFFSNKMKLFQQVRDYSVWDWFDVVISLAFLFCLILRVTIPCGDFDWVRNAYAITLSMCFMRFMHFYYAHPSLGPKVVMIINMVNDVIFFVAILIIFILSYGVASLSLLSSHSGKEVNKDLSFGLMKDIFYRPYWQMYGELYLDGDDGIAQGQHEGGSRNWLVVILFAAYMLLTNVLLLNLLIAMFGYSFEKVQSSSHKYWAYIRHDLIYEYYKRPVLPPPFICISHLLRLIEWFSDKLCKCGNQNQSKCDDFQMDLDLSEHRRLSSFEQQATDKYCKQKFGGSSSTPQPTLEKLESFLESLSHKDEDMSSHIENNISNLNKQEERLKNVEAGLQNLDVKLDEILKLFGAKPSQVVEDSNPEDQDDLNIP